MIGWNGLQVMTAVIGTAIGIVVVLPALCATILSSRISRREEESERALAAALEARRLRVDDGVVEMRRMDGVREVEIHIDKLERGDIEHALNAHE